MQPQKAFRTIAETSKKIGSSTVSKIENIAETSKQIGSTTAKTIVVGSKKVGSGVSQILKDFSDFLDRGNVIDVAVALVMGASFTSGKFLN
jgi:hypothetical protein